MLWKHLSALAFCAAMAFAQNITTVAGNSSWGLVYNVKLDAAGNLYVADQSKHSVYKIDRAGVATTIAGTGRAGYSGDGGPATAAQLSSPGDAVVAPDGTIYISDGGNDRIRRIAPNGIITTIAGSVGGFTGDGGPATAARINNPFGLALDRAGNLYFSDFLNFRIRRITPAGIISTVAGTGRISLSGDGGPATAADGAPCWLAVGPDGSIFYTDDGDGRFGGFSRVRKVSPAGVVTTVAGTGIDGFTGDGGPARAAQFRSVSGVAVDQAGNVFISDVLSVRIRRVDPNGTITTYAGNGTAGAGGDGGPALSAQLNWPSGLTTDPQGNIYFADRNNLKIRRIDAVAFDFTPQFQPPDVRTLGVTISSVTPGALVTIDGRNLSAGVSGLVTAPDLPLPASLQGVTVTMDGIAAPVYSVRNDGQEQLIVQAPYEVAGRGAINVVVNNGLAASASVSVGVQSVQPSLILLDGIQAAALHADGTLIHAGSPAAPGESIQLMSRGLGAVSPQPPTGASAADASSRTVAAVSLTIGGSPADVASSGLVPGFIGLYQVTATVPASAAGMKDVVLSIEGASAAPAKLAVR